MRLIQVTASRVWRGHEQKIIYLYEAFAEYGYVEDQWIICIKDSEIYNVAKGKGMQVIGLPFKSEYDFKFAKSLKKIADDNKADIVFIHNSDAHTISVLSALFYGLKLPLVLCRTLIRRVDTNWLRKFKYNFKQIRKIIAVSQPVVDVLKFAVKDWSRMVIVGSVTDIHKFKKQAPDGSLRSEFNIPDDHKIIGNIAAFTGFKDIPTWINTVEELVKRGNIKATFFFVGIGALESEIMKMVADKGLEKHIIFAGFRRDIPTLLPDFDLFLFTSNNEPTGGVLLEAYACRVPVVAANAGGIPEVVVDKQTGLLAQVGNPIDFADKVEYLLGNEELQNTFRHNGYEFLKANFTKEVIARKMFNELQDVLDRENNGEYGK